MRHGFHTVETGDISGRGLRFSLMVRLPHSGPDRNAAKCSQDKR